MKTLMPLQIVLPFLLLLVQTYLVFYLTILLLRRMKLLKQPYSGMDYVEIINPIVVLLGVFFISTSNAWGIFQAAKTYTEIFSISTGRPLSIYFGKSFLMVLLFCIAFIAFNFMNIRILFQKHYVSSNVVISLLLSAMAVGIAVVCWIACKEIIENITPKFVNYN